MCTSHGQIHPSRRATNRTGESGRSTAASMHLQMRIATQLSRTDKRSPRPQRQPLFGAAILPPTPAALDEGNDLLGTGTLSQRAPQIDAEPRIETEIPHAVRREAAPVATPT